MNTLHVDEREDRVVVTLDRPAQRNAINAEMIDELHQVCGRSNGIRSCSCLRGAATTSQAALTSRSSESADERKRSRVSTARCSTESESSRFPPWPP